MAHVFAQSGYYREKQTYHQNRAEEHFEEIKDILDAL